MVLLDDDTYPTCDMMDDGSLDDGFEPEEGNEHADCPFDDDDTPRVEEVYNEDGTTRMEPATDKEPGDHCMGLRGLCSDPLGPLPAKMVVRRYGQWVVKEIRGIKYVVEGGKKKHLDYFISNVFI